MINLTKQEKIVLCTIAITITLGSILQYAFKQYPQLMDVVNLVDSQRIYPKLDINKATQAQLVSIPYIGEYTAKNIVSYRDEHGPFETVEQIKQVKGIRENNYAIFSKYLLVSN